MNRVSNRVGDIVIVAKQVKRAGYNRVVERGDQIPGTGPPFALGTMLAPPSA